MTYASSVNGRLCASADGLLPTGVRPFAGRTPRSMLDRQADGPAAQPALKLYLSLHRRMFHEHSPP